MLGSDLTELPIAAGVPCGAAIPTMICSPSATRRAMFSPIRSAPSSAPPAAVSASAIRAPGLSVTRPGLCTKPTTLTTTGSSGRAAAVLGDGLADETISTGGSLADATGGGSSRIKVNTVTSTARMPTAASAMAPARPGSARTVANQPAVLPVSGSHRDSEVSGSASSAVSESVSAPRRRCGRSAGGSVRMRPTVGSTADHSGHQSIRSGRPVDQFATVDEANAVRTRASLGSVRRGRFAVRLLGGAAVIATRLVAWRPVGSLVAQRV